MAEHLFSAAASRDKVYFINSERSAEDRELKAKQKKFGECLAIGKETFSHEISEAINAGGAPTLELHSFIKCEVPEASDERASVAKQEAFLISGKQDEQSHFRDILDRSHSYRAERKVTGEIVKFLKTENSIALILGGICSGKTLIFEECIISLMSEGETVFRLNSKFYDLLPEVQKIVEENPSCIIAIDDCFSLKYDLRKIVRMADSSGTRMLLASRTLAYDSEEDLRVQLQEDTRFQAFDTEVLTEDEGLTLIDCTDRIGGWGATVGGLSQKRRILERDHSSRLSGFLLGIFRSQHIRRRFLSELDLLRSSGKSTESALIIALYLKSIGENVQENVLSEMIGLDSVRVFNSARNSEQFISYNPERNSFDLLPSVNAREALRKFFDSKTVTDTIVEAVRSLELVRHEPAFKRVFTELMRYTQLKQVVKDFDQQDRFFDRLSEMWFCNRHVLFWLQWSMAMRGHEQWSKAEQYLDEAYGRAKEITNFDTSHLDDQKAGLLLDSVPVKATSADCLRRFQEAGSLLSRSMNRGEVTSHNYLTLRSLDGFFEKVSQRLIPVHQNAIAQMANRLREQVEKKHNAQYEGGVS